ncbi:MAG: aminotransferase class V-fold PLP-dependent enzyme [Acidobacteriota bacterium]
MTAQTSLQWKNLFSDFGGRAYLDCAAQGPFPKETAEEVRRALRLKEHPEEIEPGLFEDLPARARSAVARLIGCNPASIALGTGASHGLNLAARGLPLERGDEVLLAQGEFPANVYPWMNLERDGVRVRFVAPSRGRCVEAEEMVRAMGHRTRLVSVSLVAFSTGYRVDLQALGEACRRRGAFLVVDGAQAIGAIDFRVADFPIDVLAVSGYKWLLGPYGSGFTYVSPRLMDRIRVGDVNWHGIEGAGQLNRRASYRLQFREGARRFDAAEPASFLNVSALAASVEFLSRVRVPTIEAHVRRLLDHVLQGLRATRLRAVSDLTPRARSTILSLEAPSVEETREIYRRLIERGVVVSLRDNLIRVSPNIYNSADDIDRFLAAAAG